MKLTQLYEEKLDKKEQFFHARTRKHIKLIKQAARQIVAKYPELKKLLIQVESHDASKFQEPEYTPYLSLTWNKFKGIKDTDARFNAATLHHMTTNSHHPECHLDDKAKANLDPKDKSLKCVDATKMPDLDIAEMVADWQAMSVELKKNTVKQWYDSQKDVRWHFSDEQDALINKLIEVF
jgi:hypothetical protein